MKRASGVRGAGADCVNVWYNCAEMDVVSVDTRFSSCDDKQLVLSFVVMSKSAGVFVKFGLLCPTAMPPNHHVHNTQIASKPVNRAVDYFNLFGVSCVDFRRYRN